MSDRSTDRFYNAAESWFCLECGMQLVPANRKNDQRSMKLVHQANEFTAAKGNSQCSLAGQEYYWPAREFDRIPEEFR